MSAIRRANPDAAKKGSCLGPMWLNARATRRDGPPVFSDADQLLRELAERIRAGRQQRMIFRQRSVRGGVNHRRARDHHPGAGAAGCTQAFDQVMRAADVGRERRLRRSARPARHGRRRRSGRRRPAARSRAPARHRLCRAGRRPATRREMPSDRSNSQSALPRRRRPLPGDQRSAFCGASRSSRWLPANPAAPVTSVAGNGWSLARDVPERAAERREIPEAGQRERQEEPVVGGHDAPPGE